MLSSLHLTATGIHPPSSHYLPYSLPTASTHYPNYTMAPSRQLQNWSEEGLAWRVAMAFADNARKEDWSAAMDTLKAQGWHFTESPLRYVEPFPTRKVASLQFFSPLLLVPGSDAPSNTPPIMADRTLWTADAHCDLLMAVMNNITFTPTEWDTKVAPELREKGYKYTYKAAVYVSCLSPSHPTFLLPLSMLQMSFPPWILHVPFPISQFPAFTFTPSPLQLPNSPQPTFTSTLLIFSCSTTISPSTPHTNTPNELYYGDSQQEGREVVCRGRARSLRCMPSCRW